MSTGVSYAYRAARRDGALEIGTVDAESRSAASAELAGRGLYPITITLEQDSLASRRPVSAGDLALGFRMLGSLLEAGLPMGRALAALEELAPDSWRPALPAIRAAVREGKGLSSALRTSPVAFPPLAIGLVHAGEAGSGLAEAVRRAADVTEASAATRAAVRSALAYPIVLTVAGSVSLLLLVGIVLPRFALILTDLGQSLPATTRFVLAGGTVARHLFLPAIIAGAAAVVAVRAWTATEGGRRRMDEWLLAVPVLGPIRHASATAHICAALAALLECGVPIAPALVHSAQAAGDAAVCARLMRARERVITGQRLSTAAIEERALTATAERLARAGEESGRLAPMLAHAARLERERVDRMVKGVVGALEPTLIITFGGIVAVVAAALLQAVYSVRPGL